MKQIQLISLFIGSLLFGQQANGQGFTDYITTVKKACYKIDNDKTLIKVTINDTPEFPGVGTDSGAELKGYFKKDVLSKKEVLCKIKYVKWFFWGSIEEEYYFDTDQLIHVFEKENHYPYDPETKEYITNGEVQITVSFTGDYYYKTMQIVGQDIVGKKFVPDKKGASARLLNEANKYALLLKAKKG